MRMILTICLSLAGFLSAQPTLTKGTHVQLPGQVVQVFTTLNSAPSPGNGGANQTWDFSSFVPDASGNSPIYDPQSSPRSVNYPDATTLFYGSDSGTLLEAFYLMNNDSIVYYGYYQSITAQGQTFIQEAIFSDPEVRLRLPMVFGEVQTDSFSGSVSTVLSGMVDNYYREGVITSEYDGYGTLITPTATFPNVARVKTTEVYDDTLAGIPGFYFSFASETYEWWLPGESFPIARYFKMVESGLVTQERFLIFEQWATDLDQDNAPLSASIYPNPVLNHLNIRIQNTYPEPLTIKIQNSLGQVLWHDSWQQVGTSSIEERIDLSDLPSGIYSLEISGNRSHYSSLLVKE